MTKKFMVFLAGAFTACLFLSSGTVFARLEHDKPATCGDGKLDLDTEVCDGTVFLKNCEEAGYAGGSPSCSEDCYMLSFSTCLTPYDPCNNGILDVGEACDGAIFIKDHTCQNAGYDGGTLLCSPDCQSITYAHCTKKNTTIRELLARCSILDEDKKPICLSYVHEKMNSRPSKSKLAGFPCDDENLDTVLDTFNFQDICKGIPIGKVYLQPKKPKTFIPSGP